MLDFLDYLSNFFLRIYRADNRPEARKLTLGCFIIVVVIVVLLGVIYSIRW